MIQFHNPILEKSAVCEQHGEYISKCFFGNAWTKCPVCDKERKQADEAKIAAEEAQKKRQAWANKLGNAGIPERFKMRTLETYQLDYKNVRQQLLFEFCQAYASDFAEKQKMGQSFLMLGMPGTGKTHLSIGIALAIMKQGNTAIFTTASRMFRTIKDTYRKGSEQSESEVMSIYTDCDLLIVDEVGVQRGSDYEKDTFFDVINERYENLKPTIVLSNLTIEEIKNYLGERVFDRLRENGGKAFLLDWPSHRAGAHYD